MNKKKIIILISIILGVLVLTLGIAYAVFTYQQTGTNNQQLVLGDIYMHYKESTSNINIENMMPTDINDYISYYVNSIMQEQIIEENELYKCVYHTIYDGWSWDTGETAKAFCQGTGTNYGYTFQQWLDQDWVPSDYMFENNIVLIQEDGSYIFNSELENQSLNELSSCVITFSSYTFDEGSDATSFCQGSGMIDGSTFQDMIDNDSFTSDEIKSYLNESIIISKIEGLPYFEFTVSGKNTYSEKDIYYEVLLSHGDVPEDKEEENRIRDNLLRFALVEVDGNLETEIFTNYGYSDLTSQRIHVETINANTLEEIENTYRLYMWIDESTIICGGEATDSCDYYTSGDTNNWSDVFASIKVNVSGDFVSKVSSQADSCFEYKYSESVNPIMATQEIEYIDLESTNELTVCVSVFSSWDGWFDSESDAKSYCQGTGTQNGNTFQEDWDEWMSSNTNYYEYLIENNIMILSGESYVVNPTMASQEVIETDDVNTLTKCYWRFAHSTFDAGSDAKSYCSGTGTIYDWTFQDTIEHGYDLYYYVESDSTDAFLLENQIVIEDKSKVEITSYDSTCGSDVVIPKKIGTSDVVALGLDFTSSNKRCLNYYKCGAFAYANIKSVYIPNTIKVIEQLSFIGSNVESIVFEENPSLKIIDAYAFFDSGLKSIEIPSNVIEIERAAFEGVNYSTLEEVIFEEISKLTTIGNDAFNGQKLTNIEIPSGVTTIGSRAFEENTNLTNVNFQENSKLTTIGEKAFESCSLSNIEIPDSVTTIGGSAFSNNQLEIVTIGSGIQYIGSRPFVKSSTSNPNLESITFTSKTCEEIKNIEASSTDTRKYFPWLYSSSPYYQSGYTATIIGTDGECSY